MADPCGYGGLLGCSLLFHPPRVADIETATDRAVVVLHLERRLTRETHVRNRLLIV